MKSKKPKKTSIEKEMIGDLKEKVEQLEAEKQRLELEIAIRDTILKTIRKMFVRYNSIFGKVFYEATVRPGTRMYEDLMYLDELYGGEKHDS